MSMDIFRVGRGGAGNWYSKKDQEEAEKRVGLVRIPFAPPLSLPLFIIGHMAESTTFLAG